MYIYNILGRALSVVEEQKFQAHLNNCQTIGISFTPLVVETLEVGVSEEAADYSCLQIFVSNK